MSRLRAFAVAGVVAVVAAAAIGGTAAFLAAGRAERPHAGAHAPVWTETAWPFPVDPWGPGRAFRCKAADCGGEVHLYLRAKAGFCNCTTGVADDEELDRVGDVDLAGAERSALGPGRPIVVHGMKGRSRGYAVGGRGASGTSALSIAFNDRCDVIVATAVVRGDGPAAREAAVLEFLNRDLVLRWAEATLGI
jgi:hypothetical protein